MEEFQMPERSDPELPPLPYDYDALEPHISEQVLEWHHDTHHQGYVNGLDAAEETLAENRASGDHSTTGGALGNVTHNGSGHYLHTLFWENMSPNGGGEPEGELRERIEEDFGSYDAWKDAYAEDNGSETDLENEMAEAFSNDDEARTVETRARSSVVDDTCEVFRQRVDGKQRQGRWCYFEP